MDDLDQIDTLEADLAALEQTLGDAGSVAASFDAELRAMQTTLGETTRDLGSLERGFSSGLKRAFDGLVLDGKSLSDTLQTASPTAPNRCRASGMSRCR